MRVHEQNKTSLSKSKTQPKTFELIAGEITAVRDFIRARLVTGNKTVDELLDHVTAQSGKMLRPALVLLSAKCVGRVEDTHIKLAAITEMIHTATLLHDDVIDEAKSRRNAATANVLWGNESAVLLGDLVLTRVFELCSQFDSTEISQILARTTTKICQGEIDQNIQQRNFDLSIEKYMQIISDKTASLFACSSLLGARIAGASPDQTDALESFGLNLGIAFQITDDLLDITGCESTVGKTLGTDIEKCKLTLPIIHLLEDQDPDEKKNVIDKLRTSDRDSIIALLHDRGSLDYTKKIAEKFCLNAVNSLQIIDNSSAKQALIGIANSLTARLA